MFSPLSPGSLSGVFVPFATPFHADGSLALEGVAPLIVEQMVKTMLELKQQGVGILLSEQNLHFASQVADYSYVLERGQIRYHGTMDALLSDAQTRSAYLGL